MEAGGEEGGDVREEGGAGVDCEGGEEVAVLLGWLVVRSLG